MFMRQCQQWRIANFYILKKEPFFSTDEPTRVYMKTINAVGERDPPCSMPKVLTVSVVLTNGTIFYNLELQKRDQEPEGSKPVYSIRRTAAMRPSLVRETIAYQVCVFPWHEFKFHDRTYLQNLKCNLGLFTALLIDI